MTISRNIPAPAVGALLALGAYGCASSGPSYEASGYGSTGDASQGDRGAVVATVDPQITPDTEPASHSASGIDARGVLDTLADDPRIPGDPGTRIGVTTWRNDVTLTGRVVTPRQAEIAAEDAHSVDGVRDVKNFVRARVGES